MLSRFQSYPTLCDFMDCSPLGSSVRGILQARILELSSPSSGALPNPGIETASLISPALAGGVFTSSITWEVKVAALNCSGLPPGFLTQLLALGSHCSNLFFAQMLTLSSKS